jgi:hypothetical protein
MASKTAAELAALKQDYARLSKLTTELISHLDYCGWGRDRWERECGEKTRNKAVKFVKEGKA